ncbi:DUF2946 family protein [Phenylobacterium sp.]|uniref:DUF2946 family protein n=1 Tax=Phenylobacterium sp. TaxID=1871053 RepID=UPI002D1FA03F|nr:DUF2946 family protein [Phenylobacterium sp.]
MAAFFAVALLTFAGVKSTVMQAVADGTAPASAPMAMPCPDMPGMDMSAMPGMGAKPGDAAKKAAAAANCPFCVAAAHVALQSLAAPIPTPTSVAWIAPPPVSDHSARGPPLVRPKARGPPAPYQTV